MHSGQAYARDHIRGSYKAYLELALQLDWPIWLATGFQDESLPSTHFGGLSLGSQDHACNMQPQTFIVAYIRNNWSQSAAERMQVAEVTCRHRSAGATPGVRPPVTLLPLAKHTIMRCQLKQFHCFCLK